MGPQYGDLVAAADTFRARRLVVSFSYLNGLF